MLWRLASALAGAPLGWLVASAFLGSASWGALGGAAGSAVLLLGIASAIERARPDDPARGRHLAVGASPGFAAVPAAVLVHWGLAPNPLLGAAAIACVLTVSLYFASLATGPSLWLRWALRSALAGVVGAFVFVAASAAVAAWGAPAAQAPERRASTVYDFDAQVETRRLPDCQQRIGDMHVLPAAGAHPALDHEGRFLWFDAPVDGSRQIHRLALETGETQCWTCEQPGHNRRPAVGPHGSILVYDSDRHADVGAPDNTELYQTTTAGDDPPAYARRLTFADGPDERAVLGPSPAVIVWSRREDGRYFVGSATLLRGHGGVILREPGVLLAGGAAWTSAVAWSPDARVLVTLRGNPLRPLEAVATDPATGDSHTLYEDVPPGHSVAFNADGGWVAAAATQRRAAAGLLPDALGFLVARFAHPENAYAFRDTRVAVGPTAGPLRELDLGEHAAWGAPTGLALSADADRIVVAQRRPDPRPEANGEPEERLLDISLVCR